MLGLGCFRTRLVLSFEGKKIADGLLLRFFSRSFRDICPGQMVCF